MTKTLAWLISTLMWGWASVALANLSDIEPSDSYDGRWQFERLQEAHNASYFSALRRSQRHLYDTLGWGWPTSKISQEGNLDSMRYHQQQHDDGQAYSYVIIEPEHRLLKGGLFISSVQRRSGVSGFNPQHHDMEITFWLNEDGQAHDQGAQLITELLNWLEQDWDVASAIFPIAETNHFARELAEMSALSLLAEDRDTGELLYRYRAP